MESLEYQRAMRERLERVDPALAARVQALETQWRVVIPTLATREQLEQLRCEMEKGQGALRAEMEKGQGALRAEMEKGQGALRAEMEKGFGAMRAEIHQIGVNSLRWSVGVTISALVALATLATALMPLLLSAARVNETTALALPAHGEDDGN